MARPRKFSSDDVLDAARDVVWRTGHAATVAQVAIELNAPSGSVYYRFATRDELFISLWLRSIRGFHRGFVEALTGADPVSAVVEAAVFIPGYCRAHPAEAVSMTLYRWQDLLDKRPQALADDIDHLNDALWQHLSDLCAARYGVTDERRMRLLDTAVRQSPYGLVRPHLVPATPGVPEWIDEMVAAASRAIAALGDDNAGASGTLDDSGARR